MRLIAPLLALLFFAGQAAADEPDAKVTRLIALYDELCLRAFPDDAALDAAVATKDGRPLTPDEVRGTLNDNPGRGWLLNDDGHAVQIMLELPPYYACSVRRWTADGFGDLSDYRELIEAYKANRQGFLEQEPYAAQLGDVALRGTGEQRDMPDGSAETLLLYEQRYVDPALHGTGENAVNIRFVHQFVEEGSEAP